MPGPEDSADLTARLVALREAVENEIAASRELLLAKIQGLSDERAILLDGLRADRAGIEGQIRALRELQDAYHSALQQDAIQHEKAETEQVANLAAAMQLQLDQRFASTQAGSTLLQQEMDRRFAAVQIQLDQRFAVEEEARKTAMVTAASAIQAALQAAETAVNKAEMATEKRFDGVNEFRRTLADQTASFPTRQETSVQMDALRATGQRNADAIKDIELRFTSRLDTMAGQQGGAEATRTEQRLSQGAIVSLIVGVLIFLGLIVSTVTLVVHR